MQIILQKVLNFVPELRMRISSLFILDDKVCVQNIVNIV